MRDDRGGGTAAMGGGAAIGGGGSGALGPGSGLPGSLGPTGEPLRPTGRPVPAGLAVPAWRRLLGLAITLTTFAAVAFVAQAAGWLTDAQSATHAAQAADGQARLVVMALRRLTPDGEPGEARFAEVAPRLGALLVRDSYRSAGETVLTFQVTGRATSGAFGGRRPVSAVRCYSVDWRPPVVGEPWQVTCPPLPDVPLGSPPADQLVQQLTDLGGLATGPYLAGGVPGACAFGQQSRTGFHAWPAPATARCDAAEAARASAFTD